MRSFPSRQKLKKEKEEREDEEREKERERKVYGLPVKMQQVQDKASQKD